MNATWQSSLKLPTNLTNGTVNNLREQLGVVQLGFSQSVRPLLVLYLLPLLVLVLVLVESSSGGEVR